MRSRARGRAVRRGGAAHPWCHGGGHRRRSRSYVAVRQQTNVHPSCGDELRRTSADPYRPPWQCVGRRASTTCTGDAAFDTALAAATTDADVGGDDQRPSLELCEAGPRRARRAPATKPMPTTAVIDGLGDHRSAATAMPGGLSRCGSDACPAAVGDGSGAVWAKVASIAGTKAAMSWGPLLVVRLPSRTGLPPVRL